MRNIGFLGFLLTAMVGLLVACGGSDATATTPPATTAPTASAPTAAPPSASTGSTGITLEQYALDHANGPSAIYVGDLGLMAGPAPSKAEGDADGNVPLEALQHHLYVYESDYYKSLLEKAHLTNPTPLVSTGQSIKVQYACVNRALLFCRLVESYLAPNVLARTNGQLEIVPTSYPELSISGPDNLDLIESGVLDMADIEPPYVAGVLPAFEINYLQGLYASREDQYKASTALAPYMEKLVTDASEGVKFINLEWQSGNDFFFFTNTPMTTPEAVKGMKVRAFGTSISDWIRGMGADAEFVAFAEVYTALERGILDAGVTGGDAGHGQRWYEVTKYINGPLTSWPNGVNVMNKSVWDRIPADMQRILIEEGAKSELEALRIGSIQNERGLQENIEAGMEYVEFPPEVRALSDKAVMEEVVPNWVGRVGGPDSDAAKEFNDIIAPITGIYIQPDGSAVKK